MKKHTNKERKQSAIKNGKKRQSDKTKRTT